MEFEQIPQVLQNKELEQSFLGSILVNPNCLETISLEPDELYYNAYADLYRILRGMYERKTPIDIVTVSDELEKRKGDGVNIVEITSMITNVPNSFHVDAYAEKIRDYARRRKVLASANELAQAAFDLNSPIEDSVSSVVETVVSGTQVSEGATHWSSAVEQLYLDVCAKVEEFKESGGQLKIDGHSTGYPEIDECTGGVQDGEVMYIAGPPAVGKSVLAHKIAFNIASTSGLYAIVYSLEMSRIQVARRLVSAWHNIDIAKLRIGNLTDEQFASLPMAVSNAFDVDLNICEESEVSMNFIRADIARIMARKRDKKLGLVLIDYALLVDAPGKDELERSAYISRKSKTMCKHFKVPFIMIESVVKAGMDGGSVQKSSMRGSGQQIHDADTVMYVLDHIPMDGEEKRTDVATCVFTKMRESLGNTKVFNLRRGNGIPNFYSMSSYSNPDDSPEVF